MAATVDVIPLREATRAWFLISLQTFGGPAGQIAVMQRDAGRREALDRGAAVPARAELLHAAAGPGGPAARDLHRLAAQRLGRRRLIAGVLFVLPGMLALLVLSWVYVTQGDTTLVVAALFLGLAPAVLAIVVQAVVRVGGRALRHRALWLIAVASFVALAVSRCRSRWWSSAPAVVGWLLGRWRPGRRSAPPRPAEPTTAARRR